MPLAQGQPDRQVVLDLATQEWEHESACILALDDLLLHNDRDLLGFFGQGILEREQQLRQEAERYGG